MQNTNGPSTVSRRAMLAQSGAAAVGLLAAGQLQADPADIAPAAAASFKFSLNMATIRGQKLSLPEQVDVAAKAGYHGIEPWVEELKQYATSPSKAAELKRQIANLGLVVPSAIGFADWINDDDARRAAGLEQWKREAELVRSIGGVRMAAPPSGAYNVSLDLRRVAERYRKLLDLSCPLGIVPELEMWGGSKTLSRMSHIAYVLVEVGHPSACGLLDVFHIFKGGSDFAGIRVFNGAALHVLHMNDYPAGLTRATGTDADRVYPGDGGAPLVSLLRDLRAIRYDGYLSLELFNRGYWKQDALTVARTGREKMQALVNRATEHAATESGRRNAERTFTSRGSRSMI